MSNSGTYKVLITGAGGQLGHEFQTIIGIYSDIEPIFCGRADLDISDPAAIEAFMVEHTPAVVINCAAYTNVEKAEDEPEIAHLHNAIAPHNLALACKKHNALLVHFSTDYVFDGTKDRPYSEADTTAPLSVYGKSKLDGENLILASGASALIFRVAWLYSTYGKNFYKTMLRLATEKSELRVVADQKASPTYARHLAHDVLEVVDRIITQNEKIPLGLYHYSQEGVASWYEFTREILLNAHSPIPVIPVTTADFPTKAKRPAFSKLDNSAFKKATGIQPISWKEGLIDCMHNNTLQNESH